ncbi:MAG: VanW family protein [Sandaracinaceae bacterium]|nr:VanW family protein [Sandaracinaceae bacterium]
MIRRPHWFPRPPSMLRPWLYHAALFVRRAERTAQWVWDEHDYRLRRSSVSLASRVQKHQSVLIRRTPGADPRLQENKVRNLRLVIERLDGTVIGPGQTFSFCKLVGRPTRRRGFLDGMELVRGVARAGVGGGICQASNLIYWLALHSPLEVVERHHHSFDPFPGDGRVLPFASGATVMYNHRDLRLRNTTQHAFQFRFWLDQKCLNAELRSEVPLRHSYRVIERNHRFEQIEGTWFRENELWRATIDRETGHTIREEKACSNRSEVKYAPSKEDLLATSSCNRQ